MLRFLFLLWFSLSSLLPKACSFLLIPGRPATTLCRLGPCICKNIGPSPSKGRFILTLQKDLSFRARGALVRSSKREDDDDEQKPNRPFRPHDHDSLDISFDSDLLVADLLAIILASQLIGLVDIVNTPEFILAGGWFQPLPAVPSTLGSLVQRIAGLSVLWVISVIATTSIKTTGLKEKEPKLSTADGMLFLKKEDAQSFALFCLLRIALAISQSFFLSTNENSMAFIQTADWIASFRDCYFVGLFTIALRYLYYRYFPY